MNHNAINAILDRLAKATGADREMDAAIVRAFCPEATISTYMVGDDGDVVFHANELGIANKATVPLYTASVDAALALVERVKPGWAWFVDWIGMPDQPACHAEIWLPAQRSQHLGRERERGEAATPALAILTALLRAEIGT